jgi:thiosulfate dehydrogenase
MRDTLLRGRIGAGAGWLTLGTTLVLALLWATLGGGGEALAAPLEVELCDGETTVQLASAPTTRAAGQQVADALMASWRATHPEATWVQGAAADWESAVRERHSLVPAHDNGALLRGEQGAGHPARDWSELDLALWKREAERLAAAGARIFHSSEELGSTIAVSCDMCHPDAANTHPETYPKYQTQIGRAVLLRDMINWCLEHPVRAAPWAADDPRLRAVEAYIYAQRAGTPLAYGKH